MMRLLGFDSIIDSDLPLPGGAPASASGAADITVAMHEAASLAAGPPPLYRIEGNAIIFSAPGVAAYRCTHDAIAVTPFTGSDPTMVSALLIATALPALFWLRGDVMLHATAACLAGRSQAIAFCGPSGIGKSTVAAQLLARSARLVADDSVRLSTAQPAMISGLSAGYHPPASAGRHFRPLPPAQQMPRAPLGAVVILSRTSEAPDFTRLSAIDAIELLLRNQHRPRIPAALGRQHVTLRRMADLARAVPVYRWNRRDAHLSDWESDQLSAL